MFRDGSGETMSELTKARKFVEENPVTAQAHGLDVAVLLALANLETQAWIEDVLGDAASPIFKRAVQEVLTKLRDPSSTREERE